MLLAIIIQTTPGYEQAPALIGSLLIGYHVHILKLEKRQEIDGQNALLLIEIFTLVSCHNLGVVYTFFIIKQ